MKNIQVLYYHRMYFTLDLSSITTALSHPIEQIGEKDLPAVQALLTIQDGAESIKTVARSLLNPELDLSEREALYDDIAAARDYYIALSKELDALDILNPTALLEKIETFWEIITMRYRTSA